MPKRVAVVLSGCGFKDGAEIHESVLTLLALDRAGAHVEIFAPDIPQTKVVNHLTGEATHETRNVLVESARIARGKIADVKKANASAFDALVFPGGFGAAMNLCSFGADGAKASVNPDIAALATSFYRAKKPIGVICIAPAMLAKILEGEQVTLTIGNDAGTADALESLSHKHENCGARGFVVDRTNKIVSTPAYMLAGWIGEAADGIEKLVKEVLALA
jgi:enhancing lycopene biosynthesis protein 2